MGLYYYENVSENIILKILREWVVIGMLRLFLCCCEIFQENNIFGVWGGYWRFFILVMVIFVSLGAVWEFHKGGIFSFM